MSDERIAMHFEATRATGLRSALRGPSEGWATLGAVILMVVSIGWSIDDAKWVRGIGPFTDFLPLVGLPG